jgi:hypothetical protein
MCCDHDTARSSVDWFRLLTERLPHAANEEAYQDIGSSTLALVLGAEAA